ncbi:T9SS type A sorting domain-containing protein [Taibaiella lutea]|uniref:T9SS type A sorting domain-containing protein n=1 Tax=Taibaiella lutea TaxID=2608001 RepID=A0A5M6CIJ9_9BACT|nr:T9SS type A sorting domain-containing protein [Taibaiella lutea]KAA5533215.1 T9SS type A sorting domain-containing protein [Taibaiella lutea]
MTKKLFCFIPMLMFITLTNFAQSPSFTSFIHSGDSCLSNTPEHLIRVYGSVTNADNAMDITIYWGDGTSINPQIIFSTGLPPSAIFYPSHTYLLPGIYTAIAVLFDANGDPVDSSQLTINAFCHSVMGKVYKRNDANCAFDPGTDNLLNIFQKIEVRKNNIPIDTFVANSQYHYSIPQVDFTSEFSFHPLNTSDYQQVCPGVNSPYKVRLDTLNGLNNNMDYAYECNATASPDLFVYMSGYLRFVNNSSLTITTGNLSCTPQNGTVTLNIDPQYTYYTASLTPASVNGQTVTWNLTNLSGNNYPHISVILHPADTLTPGDTSCHTVSITPIAGDINVANNTYTFCDTIHASYDPNEKKVSPMGDIAAGQLLTYTINFENLGNDTAFNIHIVDTLSANVDPSSFEIIASSHHVNTDLFDYGTTKIVKFEFNNINLEDKDHPDGNKGFVMYRAKAKSNLVAGSEVKNTAHVFFDINPAIVTNTVSNKIPIPNGIKEVGKYDGLKIYPNPAKSMVTIENKDGLFNQVKIFNAIGQVIKEVALKNGINKVDVSAMNAGIYYLIINGNNGARSIKFVKL